MNVKDVKEHQQKPKTEIQNIWSKHRDVIRLVADGRKPEDVASILGMPVSVVTKFLSSVIVQDQVLQMREASV